MNKLQRENLIRIINNAQAGVDRIESRINRMYDTGTATADKIEYWETRRNEENYQKIGMITAARCIGLDIDFRYENDRQIWFIR